MHASSRAFEMTSKTHSLWCTAVSRGWNPSPGGVMYVCLTFESTAEEPSGQCLITPAPSLFAEPSRPRANIGRSLFFYQSSWTRQIEKQLTWVPQWGLSALAHRHLQIFKRTAPPRSHHWFHIKSIGLLRLDMTPATERWKLNASVRYACLTS